MFEDGGSPLQSAPFDGHGRAVLAETAWDVNATVELVGHLPALLLSIELLLLIGQIETLELNRAKEERSLAVVLKTGLEALWRAFVELWSAFLGTLDWAVRKCRAGLLCSFLALSGLGFSSLGLVLPAFLLGSLASHLTFG